jgi:hypothetical protein
MKSPRNPAEALRLGTYLSLYSFDDGEDKDGVAAATAATAATDAAASFFTKKGVPGALALVPLFLRRRVGVPNGVAGADALDVPVVSFSSLSSFRRRRLCGLSGVLGGVVIESMMN